MMFIFLKIKFHFGFILKYKVCTVRVCFVLHALIMYCLKQA